MSMSVVLTIIFLAFVICSALFGLLRGFHKSWLRIAWSIVSIVVALIVVSTLRVNAATIDISGLEKTVDGVPVNTLEDLITLTAQSKYQLTAEEIAPLLDFANKIVIMMVGGITFIAVFLLLKILTSIAHVILCAILRVKNWGKSKMRPLGLLMGAIGGVLSFVILLTPVTGYFNAISNLSLADNDLTRDESTIALQLAVDEYENSALIKAFKATGIYSIQMGIFNTVTSVKINDTKVSLNKESRIVGQFLAAIENLNPEEDFSEEDITLIVEKYADAFTILLSSDVVDSGLDALQPAISKLVQGIENEQLNGMLSNIIADLVVTLSNIDSDEGYKIEALVRDTINLALAFSQIDENSDFEALGAELDSYLAKGYVSSKTLASLYFSILEEAFSMMEVPAFSSEHIQDIENAIESESFAFAKEFEAIDELIELVDLFNSEKEITEIGSDVGKAIDNAIAAEALVLNEELIGNVLVELVDRYVADISENEIFVTVIESLKQKIQTGGLNYEKELGAIGKLADMAITFDTDFDIKTDAASMGEQIDELLAENSSVIDKSFVNQFIASALDELSLTGDYLTVTTTIKSRLAEVNSYQEELGYLQILLEIAEKDVDFSNANTTYSWADGSEKTIGAKFDEIAPSVLCGDLGITVLDGIFERYELDQNVSYANIFDIVKSNYAEVKENIAVCGKSGSDYYSYAQVISAFAELYDAITSSDKITDNSDTFNQACAEKYEESLATLQDNILVKENGARAIAINVAESINSFLNDKKNECDDFMLVMGIEAGMNYVSEYISYLSNKQEGYEPYDDEEEEYVNEIRINKPFSYIFEMVEEILDNI